MAAWIRRASLRRRLRSQAGRIVRRYGLLPGGQPDRLGEDASLGGVRLDTRAVIFFADTRDGLYQLEQWYSVLSELDRHGGVTVICMDSRTAEQVRAATALRVITIAQDSTLDSLLSGSAVKLMLYVNYNPLNTLALRTRSVVHVNLLHGESDKAVSVSNQVKAYDFVLVAGEAAVDRYRAYTPLFDASARCLPVGRPQLDISGLARAPRAEDEPPTVLYAPTWEGASAGVAYGSVRSHGLALVQSLLADGFRVRYRPHPLTGVRDPGYGEASAHVAAALEASPTGELSSGVDLETDIAKADLLVSDVSAVPIDWLPCGRPLIVTTPHDPEASTSSTRMLEVVPRLAASDAANAAALVREQIEDDPLARERAELVTYYLGDVSPGVAMATLLRTCDELCDLRDQEWERINAAESAGS